LIAIRTPQFPFMERDHILAASRAEAARLAGQRLSEVTPSRRDFAQYVDTQKLDLAVIARIGTSPDWPTARLVAHARACDDADVAALAVVTGATGRPLADLAAVADSTTAPILRDDLIVSPSQLYHARLHGTDAAIFPAAELDGEALRELVTVASSLHMASVVEVQTASDLTAALRLRHALIGLRCLDGNGHLDLAGTLRLAHDVPPQRTVLCLPAVRSAAECQRLRNTCDAVVVGETLAATDDVARALRELALGP
jgi:indole-3-glycerol phosphate synthase